VSFLAEGADELAAQAISAHEYVVREIRVRVAPRIEKKSRIVSLAPVQRVVHVPRENQARRITADRRGQIRISGIAAARPGGYERFGWTRVQSNQRLLK
jgi:hypothetical protein